MSLLTLDGVTASYGPAQALFGIDLTVGEGEVVALMGRNGMGKTTTVRAICRLIPAAGTLTFAGRDVAGLPAHRAARLGIGLVPEGRRCFAGLTVTENLVAAARPGPWDMRRIEGLFPVLAERRRQRAGTLSGGEQQMLAIGRALATNPRLLILDEATEGLAPLIRAQIWDAVARLRSETGMAILLIDKSMREITAIADRAVLVERGKTVWSGQMRALDPALVDRYIGV